MPIYASGHVIVSCGFWINWCEALSHSFRNGLSLPGGSDSRESACLVRDLGLTPGLGKSPQGGHSNPLQHSCPENSMDRGAQMIVWLFSNQNYSLCDIKAKILELTLSPLFLLHPHPVSKQVSSAQFSKRIQYLTTSQHFHVTLLVEPPSSLTWPI